MGYENYNSYSDASMGAGGIIMMLIWLALVILTIIGWWKIFAKAGQPGWAILIPFYNMWVMIKVAQKPGWWMIMMFIPLVSFVFVILIYAAICAEFGKGAGYTLGLLFLPFIFAPMLGFGDATYNRALIQAP